MAVSPGDDQYKSSIGIEWLKFIKKQQSIFHPLSPEANNIFRSGNGISPKPYLDRDLYVNHLESHAADNYPLPTVLRDVADLADLKNEIMATSAFNWDSIPYESQYLWALCSLMGKEFYLLK
ncbi:hypothetical protein EDC94DRAFT_660985 [Helicostylum pulchrum]|nr:hypothetical protein EDC94DRAFT_660985 [Helicostylum pulchrum]